MRLRELPFLRLTLPLAAGVILSALLPQAVIFVAITAVAALTVMSHRLLASHLRPDPIFGVALASFLLSTGYLLHTVERSLTDDLAGHRQLFTVRLSGYPSAAGSGCSVRASIVAVADSDTTTHPRGSLLLWFMSDTIPSLWQPGDMLTLHLRPLLSKNQGNPCEFNYSRHLERQGIRYIAFFRAGDIVSHNRSLRPSLRERAVITAHGVTGLYRRAGLEGDALGLITALTLGDKELLEREQLTTFSRSGLMHIMAVSGLHVGMISMALGWLLFFLRGRLRPLKAVIIIVFLWGFAFITGLSPSVMRATLMFTFLQAGYLLNRPSTGMNNLLAAAFITIVLKPSVIFMAGFQLSYIAVGFILTFYHRLHRMVPVRVPVVSYLWQVAALSLVAQAGTMALTIRLFNIFPLLFLPANIVVIPVTFIMVMLALLLLAFSPCLPVASLIALLINRLAHFTLRFTTTISSAGHAVLTDIGLSAGETVILTITLALLLALLLPAGNRSIRPLLTAILLLIVCNSLKVVQEKGHNRLVSYNTREGVVTVRQYGRVLLVPVTTRETTMNGELPVKAAIPTEIRRHAATRGLKVVKIEPG